MTGVVKVDLVDTLGANETDGDFREAESPAYGELGKHEALTFGDGL